MSSSGDLSRPAGGHVFPLRVHRSATPHGPLHYFDEGAGDAIVFVHGLVGNIGHFVHVAPPFVSTHRVIGLDLPGCGASCKPRVRHSVDGYARTVLGLLESLGIAQATLVGHSAGGQVCAAAAMLKPSAVRRLVLINSAGLRAYAGPTRVAARALMQPWLLSRVLAPAAMWILDRVFHEKNDHVRRFIDESTSGPRQPALTHMSKVFHDLAPDLLQPTIARGAERLTMPTMVIWGDRDRLVPLETVRRASARLPRGRLEIIERCGHMPIIEAPEITVSLIRSFVQDFRQPALG